MRIVDSPSVAIIILNWNNWQDTLECLDSVSQLDYPNFKIVVFDNGSVNDSVIKIKQNYGSSIILLESPQNHGFAGGNNLSIEYLKRLNPDYIFFLNNDTIIEKNALSILIEQAVNDPKIGILTPKICFYNSNFSHKIIWYGGSKLNLIFGKTFMIGYRKKDHKRYHKISFVDFISGCAMLVKADVLDQIGGFDTDYFNIFEDADFCVRAKQKNYKLLYVPKACVYHKESMTMGSSYSPFSIYFQVRNRLLFIKKNVKNKWKVIAYFSAFVSIVKKMVSIILNKDTPSLAAIQVAILDFFKSSFGPGSINMFLENKKIKQ
jgi:GT2 family glycosyltransferase